MSEHDFNLDERMEELISRLEETLPEILAGCLADFDFILRDGTLVRPCRRMKVFSPDKSKLLMCYGGLRVDGTSLLIQTRVCSWECIACYPDREAAMAALKLVHEAMEAGQPLLELQ